MTETLQELIVLDFCVCFGWHFTNTKKFKNKN